MSDKGSGLGIVGYDGYEFVVSDLERSRRFYAQMLDVAETARLSDREAAAPRRDGVPLRGRQGEVDLRDAQRARLGR